MLPDPQLEEGEDHDEFHSRSQPPPTAAASHSEEEEEAVVQGTTRGPGFDSPSVRGCVSGSVLREAAGPRSTTRRVTSRLALIGEKSALLNAPSRHCGNHVKSRAVRVCAYDGWYRQGQGEVAQTGWHERRIKASRCHRKPSRRRRDRVPLRLERTAAVKRGSWTSADAPVRFGDGGGGGD
ncbi:unnamed protein product [Lampetra planeri]